MHDDRRLVEERIERLRERVGERLHRVVAKLDVSAWPTPGEPVGFDEALVSGELGRWNALACRRADRAS